MNTRIEQPFDTITANVENHKLIIYIEAIRVEDTIRFAYNLHLSLLPVVHSIQVKKDGYELATFIVNKPNHGE